MSDTPLTNQELERIAYTRAVAIMIEQSEDAIIPDIIDDIKHMSLHDQRAELNAIVDIESDANKCQRAVERYCADHHGVSLTDTMHIIQTQFVPQIVNTEGYADAFEAACSLWLSLTPEANDQEPADDDRERVETLYADMEVDLTRALDDSGFDYALYDGHVRLMLDRDSAAGIVGALVKDLDMQPDDLLVSVVGFGERACLRCQRRASIDTENTAGYFCQHCLKDLLKQSVTSGSRRAQVGDLDFNDETLDIVCQRKKNGSLHFNISQAIVSRSPDGFEFGYAGSGPAEFALNILALFIGEKRATPLYQDFKRDFIENMPTAGGTILGYTIITWIRAHEVPVS